MHIRSLRWRRRNDFTDDISAQTEVGTYSLGLVGPSFKVILRRIEDDKMQDVTICSVASKDAAKHYANEDFAKRINGSFTK